MTEVTASTVTEANGGEQAIELKVTKDSTETYLNGTKIKFSTNGDVVVYATGKGTRTRPALAANTPVVATDAYKTSVGYVHEAGLTDVAKLPEVSTDQQITISKDLNKVGMYGSLVEQAADGTFTVYANGDVSIESPVSANDTPDAGAAVEMKVTKDLAKAYIDGTLIELSSNGNVDVYATGKGIRTRAPLAANALEQSADQQITIGQDLKKIAIFGSMVEQNADGGFTLYARGESHVKSPVPVIDAPVAANDTAATFTKVPVEATVVATAEQIILLPVKPSAAANDTATTAVKGLPEIGAKVEDGIVCAGHLNGEAILVADSDVIMSFNEAAKKVTKGKGLLGKKLPAEGIRLPTPEELEVILSNKNKGELAGTFKAATPTELYLTSEKSGGFSVVAQPLKSKERTQISREDEVSVRFVHFGK